MCVCLHASVLRVFVCVFLYSCVCVFVTQGTLTQLNLDQKLYIGGFSKERDIPRDCGITTGFTGAIQRVSVWRKRDSKSERER